MANKRMFTKQITESDAFLDMPGTTQNLYFHLNMNADDDGFVNAPNRIMRSVGANKNDMDLLVAKKFIIIFDSGVIVIKHWRIHNILRTDRYKETVYKEEKTFLMIDGSGSYTKLESPPLLDCIPNDSQMITNGCQMGTSAKHSLDKHRLDKHSIAEMSDKENAAANADALKNIIEVFEQEITTLSEIDKSDIKKFLNDIPEDMIIKAIKEGAQYKAKSWKYIKAILNRCVQDGVKGKLEFDNNKSKNPKTGKYDDVYKN